LQDFNKLSLLKSCKDFKSILLAQPFVSQRETIRNNQGLCPCMLLKSSKIFDKKGRAVCAFCRRIGN